MTSIAWFCFVRIVWTVQVIQVQPNTGQCLVLDPGPVLMSHQSSGDACHMGIIHLHREWCCINLE